MNEIFNPKYLNKRLADIELAISFGNLLHESYQPLPEKGMWYNRIKDECAHNPMRTSDIYTVFAIMRWEKELDIIKTKQNDAGK